MKTITITAGELAKAYAIGNIYFICDFLSKMNPGYRPVSSEQVILEFVKAKPERFYRDTLVKGVHSISVTGPMRQRYFNTANPRLNLLKSIPPDYVLKFQMEKITNKG